MAFSSNNLNNQSKINAATIYSNFNLEYLVELTQKNPAKCAEIFNYGWIKRYCLGKKLALILPMVLPSLHQSPQQADIYFKDMLEGLYNFYEALKRKNEMACPASKSEPQNAADEMKAMNELYLDRLNAAWKAGNYLAGYLILLENATNGIQEMSLAECAAVFKEIEDSGFSRLDEAGFAGEFFKAELYCCFAEALKARIAAEDKNARDMKLFKPALPDKTNYNPLKEFFVVRGLQALKEFEDHMKVIDEFTMNSMLIWRENKPGNMKDMVSKLKSHLQDLQQGKNSVFKFSHS